MKKPKVKLNDDPKYRAFVAARDAALERVLQTAQLRITESLQKIFSEALSRALLAYPSALAKVQSGQVATFEVAHLDSALQQKFVWAAQEIDNIVARLKRSTYTLAHAGEAEAIARGAGRAARYDVSQNLLRLRDKQPMKDGSKLGNRLKLSFARLRRDLVDAYETALTLEEVPAEAALRLYRALPKRKFFKRDAVVLKKVKPREAASDKNISLAVGFVADEDWNQMVDDYKSEFVPPIRGPENIVGISTPNPDGQRNVYAWELERDVTQAFVEEVRAGQVDAARMNGIMDFVWVSVLDDRTGDFDRWADGRLTSEIKDAIESGKAPDSEFQSEVPPAHFNCRCTLAPVLNEQPEAPPSNLEDFDSWLNS